MDVAALAQFANRGTWMLVSRLKKFKGDLPVCDTQAFFSCIAFP